MSHNSSRKIVIWDADGVLFHSFDTEGNFVWSKTVTQDLGISREVVDCIFSAQWRRAVKGELNTRQHVQNVLDQYNAKISADNFLSYWLSKSDSINADVVALLDNYESYIASNQDPIRAAHFQTVFSERVRKVFASSSIGVLKPDQAFYQHIEKDLGVPPNEIWFVDDTLENVLAAEKRGWRAHQFVNVPSLVSFLETE